MDTLFELSHFPANMSSWLVLMLTLFVKGSLVLTAAGLMAFALRRNSAAARYLVWCAGLLSLLVLPVLSALLPQWQTGILPQTAVDTAYPESQRRLTRTLCQDVSLL